MAKTPNLELLYDTLDFIEENPDLHDQRYYGYRNACGSFACFAGWAVVLAGGEIVEEEVVVHEDLENYRGRLAWREEVVMPGEEAGESVRNAATEALGLTWTQASALFDDGNDLTRIKKIITAITFNEDVWAGDR